MNLVISYNQLYTNWYVGTFYSLFHEKLKNKYDVNLEFIHLNNFAQKYSVDTNYSNGLPSCFSPYNLIITNPDNNKTFINSFHDYAPAIMSNGSGIEHFDVVKFVCVSRLTQDQYNEKSKNYKIQPGFYMLENWDDLEFIEKNKNNEKIYNKVYFNGLNYGLRERITSLLSDSDLFNIKIKNNGGFLPKNLYYDELSKHKFGLNLDGAGMICYRDLECFGLNVLLFRERLNVLTYDPILEDEHYITIIDNEIKSKLGDTSQNKYIIDKIEHIIHNSIDSGKIEHVLNEANKWYYRNCNIENQFNMMFEFLEDLEILK